MIQVTKAFLPPRADYDRYLDGIWERVHLTNHGPLVTELEKKLKEYLAANHFYFLNNGTIALQLAIKALDLKGEIITTPFSYVATTSSIVWENAVPVFADIDPQTLTIDVKSIEASITPRTSGIIATHVYGIPCQVEEIEALAKKHNLKVIYDAAHAFGVHYLNRPLVTFGDVSTLSFHATKLFHTVEGGAVVAANDDVAHRLSYMRNFGHNGQEAFWGLGINGKNSEFHAAMGLSVFPHVPTIIHQRRQLSERYDAGLKNEFIRRPTIPHGVVYNYAYYPIILKDEAKLLAVRDALNKEQIFPRRYFYPSLDSLPYVKTSATLSVARAIAPCAMCLPLYPDLPTKDVDRICDIIQTTLKR